MHHQRMFGSRDDKSNIKDATLTPIQGFPPNAETNTIFNLLKTNRAANQESKANAHREEVNQNDFKV